MPSPTPLRVLPTDFARDVHRDLSRTPKQLSARYLYDALGSHLFEAICHLPWYRITRSESLLLERHGGELPDALRRPATVIELGSGSGVKLALLASRLDVPAAELPIRLVDVSDEALELAERTLARHGHTRVACHRSTYEAGIAEAAAARPASGPLLVLFLGSNIGNFSPPDAAALLDAVRDALAPGDALLLGADLVKGEADLLLAYADPIGVTSAFNKNLLARINHELGGDFDLEAFDHRAIWNAGASRVESHLVSRVAQEVRIPGAALPSLRFGAGESIWTESSYKFTPRGLEQLAREHRFACTEQWIDADALFALNLLVAV